MDDESLEEREQYGDQREFIERMKEACESDSL
jgi:hypothetical protein